ncbi:MAG: winged helix-turn-helix domain-containing protein, partial [Lachnospiraceae bacterium]|nr:winged helix-turn-helix domain-containing protein [Lachnospiraceae bacterium]
MSSKYIRIYEEIKRDIVRGIYKTGEKVPSKRLLAEENGVSVITVEHAYDLLLEEGYLEARERSGYFVLFSEGEYFLGD